jgi:excisionase family DNA binding protein
MRNDKMTAIHSGVTGRKAGGDFEPLAVSPQQACLLLNVGNTRLYELIRGGELVTYHEGRARRITIASIRARVERLAGDTGNGTPQPRRHGKARKHEAPQVSAT